MQIKEVANVTGLSVKTIRFYEERGLIDPKVEYRNGRNYRDYREEDIEMLNMVAVLRKCLFSIEQIKTMIDHPELTPDVFTEYRVALMTQRELLNLLAEKAETMDAESLDGPEVLARRLTTTASPLPLPHTDTSPHFGRFDPETPEERQTAYLRWQKRYKHRHLRRWLPVAATVLALGIMTAVRVTDHMNFNLEQFAETQNILEQAVFSITANSDGLSVESMNEKWHFYDDSTYGLYTLSGELLSQPEQLPSRPSQVETVEQIVLDSVQDRFGSAIRGEKKHLQTVMEKWVEEDLNLSGRRVDIRSNPFQQTMACAVPVEISGDPYYLVICFQQSPLLYGLREMALWYLCAAFAWGMVFAFGTTKGYGFRVIFLKQYVGRGCWNDAIIHIDEESGESTVLTKGTAGMGNLVQSSGRKKE